VNEGEIIQRPSLVLISRRTETLKERDRVNGGGREKRLRRRRRRFFFDTDQLMAVKY